MNAPFTLDGSAALEARLEALCAAVRASVEALVPRAQFEGILLGGGYGRGEGGVLRTETGDEPYNDAEFYVLLRGRPWLNRKRYGGALDHAAERLTGEAGVEVELHIASREALRQAEPSMFFYDLVMGHRWVEGQDGLLDGCEHHRAAARIPLSEATRLLMNRCSGLLFAEERLNRAAFSEADADFVGRNLAKAELAFGDVVLVSQGLYHWSCRKRHQRLEKLAADEEMPWLDQVKQDHLRGMEFKLHPVRTRALRADLIARHETLRQLGRSVWLWLESRRLKRPFRSPFEYAISRAEKCPERRARVKNRLLHVRTFGLGAGLYWRARRYPRERLLHALCWLLWERETLQQPLWRKRLQEELRTKAADFAEFVSAYRRLWTQFN